MCVITAYNFVLFAAVIYAMLVPFNEDPNFLRGSVQLEEDLGDDGVEVDPQTFVRRAVWGMLYSDDADIMSKLAEGLEKMMTVIVTVFEAAVLTVSEKKTEPTLVRTPNQAPQTSLLVIARAGHRCRQTMQFLHLGNLAVASADIMPKITRRIRLAWACYNRFQRELCGRCPVHSKGANAKGRSDGDPTVRVCGVDSWPGALRSE